MSREAFRHTDLANEQIIHLANRGTMRASCNRFTVTNQPSTLNSFTEKETTCEDNVEKLFPLHRRKAGRPFGSPSKNVAV